MKNERSRERDANFHYKPYNIINLYKHTIYMAYIDKKIKFKKLLAHSPIQRLNSHSHFHLA